MKNSSLPKDGQREREKQCDRKEDRGGPDVTGRSSFDSGYEGDFVVLLPFYS